MKSEDKMRMGGIKDKKIVVTGATGMVGSHLVAELVRYGCRDIILPVRSLQRVQNVRKTFDIVGIVYDESAVEVVEMELTDRQKLTQMLTGVDILFHCAAKVSTESDNAEELIANNVSIAESIVECSLEAGVGKVIHVSSIATLGRVCERGKYIDEDCKTSDSENYSPYALSKQAVEREMWRGVDRGLYVTAVLPSVIFGEGDWGGDGSSALIPLFASGMFVATSGVVGCVDVRDVARAMVVLAERDDMNGEKFILSAENLSYKQLMTIGAGVAGKRKPLIVIGKTAMTMASGVSLLLKKLHLIKRALTKMVVESSTRIRFYDGTKIEKKCDFVYSSMHECIERVVKAYIRESGK